MPNKALASALIAVLWVLPLGGSLAQSDAAKAGGMKVEQGKPAAKADAEPMKTASADGKRPARMNEDARHCLELITIADIVKCAEPYRY